MTTFITRRNAIIAAAAAGVLGIAGGVALRALRPRTGKIAKHIALALPERPSAETLGRAVLAAEPGLGVEQAVNELASRLGLSMDELETARVRDLTGRLKPAFVKDAAARETVLADGWVIPRSLALACAVAASVEKS